MGIKRKISDFVCAFFVFVIILLSIAALTGESFFEGAVEWDGETSVLSLFGTGFAFDTDVLSVAGRLVSFNDVLFGKGASDMLAASGKFFAEYVADGFSLAYRVARMAVGAE